MPDSASAAQISYAFGLPPKDAIAYLRGLGLDVAADWTQAADRARAGGFTAARTTSLSFVGDLRDAIAATLEKGINGKVAVDFVTKTLQAKGWSGDPNLNSARLATIIRTNAQRAYMQGRVRQYQQTASRFPYWMYVAVMDLRTRPAHAAMNGRVFRADDPIWKYTTPPCGYNCRCRIRALSESALKRSGAYLEETSASDFFTEDVRTGVDRETGEVLTTPTTGVRLSPRPVRVALKDSAPGEPIQVKKGQILYHDPELDPKFDPEQPGPDWRVETRNIAFRPDPGFGSPGPASFDPPPSPPNGPPLSPAKPSAGQPNWKSLGLTDVRSVPDAARPAAPAILPAAASRESALAQLAEQLGVSAENPVRTVTTPVETLAIDYGLLTHIVEKPRDARERYAGFVLPTLLDPFEIWLTQFDDGFYRTRYIGLYQGQKDVLVVVRIGRDGSVLYNLVRQKDADLARQRLGVLLYSRPGQ